MNDEQISLVERKYKCSFCQKGFTQKCRLDVHLRKHSGERPYKCSTCNKAFSQNQHLNRHMVIHSGEKPYECPTCQKRFTQKESLNDHLKIHSGEKQHVCSHCQKKFTLKGNLDRHVKYVHLNERSFNCDVCKKGFHMKSGLIKHLNGHIDEKPITHKSLERSSKKKQDASKSKRHLLQNRLLMNKSSLEGRCSIKGYTARRYLDGINNQEFKFEVPIVKQELISGEDLADEQIPSSS